MNSLEDAALRYASRDSERASNRYYRLKNSGICTQCGKSPAIRAGICQPCRVRIQKRDLVRTKKRYAESRSLVHEHYGGKCSCCNESEPLFLEIDHINNNGSEHRRKIGKNLYPWIVRNGYPGDLQLLCSNCNQGKKRNGGICPHKSSRAGGSEVRIE